MHVFLMMAFMISMRFRNIVVLLGIKSGNRRDIAVFKAEREALVEEMS